MARGIIELIWRSDNRTVIRDLKQIAEQSQKTTRTVKTDSRESATAMEGMAGAAERTKGVMRGLAGAVGVIGLGLGMKDLVTGGVALQSSQVQLQAALKATGLTAKGTYDQLMEGADKLATTGGFSSQQNIQALSAFVRETHNATQAQKLLSISTELSRGTGTGLAATQMMVARAYTGQVGRLQRLIGPMAAVKNASYHLSLAHRQEVAQWNIEAKTMGTAGAAWLKQKEIMNGITPQMAAIATLQDKHATALQFFAAVQKVYGGATSKFAKSAAGQLTSLKNSLQILRDTLGQDLLPVIVAIVKPLGAFVGWLTKNKVVLYVLVGAITAVTGVLALNTIAEKTSKAAGIALATTKRILGIATGEEAAATVGSRIATIAATASQWLLVAATGALSIASGIAAGAVTLLGGAIAILTSPITLVMLAIGALAYLVISNFTAIKKAVESVFNFIVGVVKTVIGWIKKHWQLVLAIITGPFGLAVYFIVHHFDQIKSVVMDVVKFVGNVFSSIFHVISWPFVKAWHLIKSIFTWIVNAVKWVVKKVTDAFGGIISVFKTVGNFLGGAVSTLTFGLLATGGVVKPNYGSRKQPGHMGTDRLHGWLTPGEGVLNLGAMNMIGGERGLNALNSGSVPGALAGSGGGGNITIQPGVVQVKLDSRTIAEAVIRYSLQRAARGPSSLSGGALSTGVAGTIDVVGGPGTIP